MGLFTFFLKGFKGIVACAYIINSEGRRVFHSSLESLKTPPRIPITPTTLFLEKPSSNNPDPPLDVTIDLLL